MALVEEKKSSSSLRKKFGLNSGSSSGKDGAIPRKSASKRSRSRSKALEAGLRKVSSQQSLASMASVSDSESIRSESNRSDSLYDSYDSEQEFSDILPKKPTKSSEKTLPKNKASASEDSLASVRDIASRWREEAKLFDSGDSDNIAPPKTKVKLSSLSYDESPLPIVPQMHLLETTSKFEYTLGRSDVCNDPVLRELCNVY
mmetsp:Transcript_9607/g.13300  ORF Transcript_9607/g.13300 Transcript_9607/m.13300 type:complete len:202 (+) Transcript_9607:105-710(+)